MYTATHEHAQLLLNHNVVYPIGTTNTTHGFAASETELNLHAEILCVDGFTGRGFTSEGQEYQAAFGAAV